MNPVRIAIFVSGGGTNCENLIRTLTPEGQVAPVIVVSNRPDAPAVQRAQRLGVPVTIARREQLHDPAHMLPLLEAAHVELIVLAGFLPLVPDYLIEAYPHRIINLHPALLPLHGGKGMYGHHVHQAVKDAGDTATGMTVHYVSEVCDGGEIIAQFSVPLTPGDTVDDIAAKEHELEMAHFPGVVTRVALQLRQAQK